MDLTRTPLTHLLPLHSVQNRKLMAAAEARAVWQRVANRCFVQEDAKRAPKLACCQSSSSTTKQVDAGPATAAEGPDHPAAGFMPLNRNPSYSSLPPDARWWLQMQPSYGYQKDFTYEQLNALEADMETLRAGFVKSTPKTSEVRQQKGECTDADGHKNSKVQKQDVNAQYGKDMKELVQYKDVREKYEIMGMDTIDYPFSKQPEEFCCDYPWIGGGGLNHGGGRLIEMNWPPWLQRSHLTMLRTVIFPHLRKCIIRDIRMLILDVLTTMDVTETQQLSEGEPTKAQLMEALCHSQTRAREAEMAAKQAYAEKEHIFKLFFRQASQLFAYKQWFQLLQLETLCIQIKNNDQPGSAVVPVVLPWMPFKGRKPRRNWRKGPKGKRGRRAEPRHDITKYAVAFALGFSLVGLACSWDGLWGGCYPIYRMSSSSEFLSSNHFTGLVMIV
ncbi:hypothetical protein Prudu_006867 [Prunus dulcis]|uniref:Uncharacterized protein n=1 Tax=Prunus dulcis TaxID=3755 RepID=A0A4Y1R0Q2_PRUDU|nr:hypothetical protein Prudu_006867 [Prunus dulcis]